MPHFVVYALAILIGGGVIAYTVFYFRKQKQKSQNEEAAHFRELLLKRLRKSGPKALGFTQLVTQNEIPPELARRVAEELFTDYCVNALADGQITEAERGAMCALQLALSIPPERASQIETKLTDSHYREAALKALTHGSMSKSRSSELELLRTRLGLSVSRAAQVVGSSARDGYLSLFRQVISDGRITGEEIEELQRFRMTLGISKGEANDIVHDEAVSLYRQWFYNILQDGEITQEEEDGLRWLRKEFGLDSLDTAHYDARLQEAKQLAMYRQGELPRIKSRKLLESGEICHWEGRCIFEWESSTKSKEVDGELIVTSDKLVFSSPVRSFALSPGKIIDLTLYSDALVIRSSTTRGTGTYFVRQSHELEAILLGLVRRHKYHLGSNYSSDLTRHIPDSVRREVWHRDGGSCVRCKAMDYLEYDHIIPHARGGANTVANVQLLCRRCNNLKRDRI